MKKTKQIETKLFLSLENNIQDNNEFIEKTFLVAKRE